MNSAMNEYYFGKYEWQDKVILIVEDDISSAFYLKEVLVDTGAELFFASDGHEAIDICEKNPNIDLVLMDIQLPVMDGYVATHEIKKINPDIVVIAQTAYVLPEEKERAYEAGCDDYITKPIDAFELLNKIVTFLG
jgi:CheY-like chemotaxis protein